VRPEPELLGQTVVVIGSSSGIGLETARRARAEGADVILTARDPDRLHRVGLELPHSIEHSHTALDHAAERRALQDCYASLSPREREAMALVVSGLLNEQVGDELGISEITVKALLSTPSYARRAYLIPRYRPTPWFNRFPPTHLLQ
jgi:FixJ family two-component response regulator